MTIAFALDVIISLVVALYFGMIAAWRRHSAAYVVAVGFVTGMAAMILLVFTGATEGFK